jgi:cell wall-associated NlpC family hydrolase
MAFPLLSLLAVIILLAPRELLFKVPRRNLSGPESSRDTIKVEPSGRTSPARWRWRPRWFQLGTRVLTSVALSSGVLSGLSLSASATGIASERTRAAALYAQIHLTDGRVEFLGQQYDETQIKLRKIGNKISATKDVVALIEQNVAKGNAQLRVDAIFAYVTHGEAVGGIPPFSTNPTKSQATNVYGQIAAGNVSTTLALLETYKIRLTRERSMLVADDQQAATATRTAARAFHEAMLLQASLRHTLGQVKGQIANYIRQQEAAAAAKSAAESAAALRDARPVLGFAAPPPNSRADIAIRAALNFVGVPYAWGGASRRGVDCSGLTMLAYAAAGIYLPHYSGAQYAATVRVPLFALQPGDLLFYGANGGEHEAMYLGHGKMIEAEHTGTFVLITDVRLGDGFVGAGRPRG